MGIWENVVRKKKVNPLNLTIESWYIHNNYGDRFLFPLWFGYEWKVGYRNWQTTEGEGNWDVWDENGSKINNKYSMAGRTFQTFYSFYIIKARERPPDNFPVKLWNYEIICLNICIKREYYQIYIYIKSRIMTHTAYEKYRMSNVLYIVVYAT